MPPTSKSGMGELHRIYLRQTRDYMLYAFVEGMRCRDQAVSVEMCVQAFCERYGVENLDNQTGKAMYYKMLHEFKNDCNTFKEQINTA